MTVKHRELLICTLIIVLQIFVFLYWGTRKTNYYIDDFYSMGYASNFTGEGDTAKYITTSPELCFDKWIENSDLKKYLLLSEEEQLFHVSPLRAVQLFFTGRIYFWFLNVAESLIGYSVTSVWPALILNLVFFVLAQLALLSLMKKLNLDQYTSFFSLAMFGFSCFVISMVVYVRFYMFVSMLMLFLLCFLHRLWNSEKWGEIISAELVILLLAYFAYKNSELTMAFFGGLMGCVVLFALIARKWKQLIINLVFGLLAVLFLALTTDYIGILFHPERYPDSNDVAVWASENIAKATPGTVFDYLIWVKFLLQTTYFGSYWLVYLLAGVVTICLVLANEKKEKDSLCSVFSALKPLIGRLKGIKPVTVFALSVWSVILLFSGNNGPSAGISAIVLLTILFLALREMGCDFSGKWLRSLPNFAFILILICTTAIYTVFCAMSGYVGIWRYYFFAFVSIAIVFWYFVDRLLKKVKAPQLKTQLLWILGVFILVNALIPFRTRNIEYIYEEEKAFTEVITANQDLYVVTFRDVDSVYDCVNLMSPEAKLYFLNLQDSGYDQIAWPDEFLLWGSHQTDIKRFVDEMTGFLKQQGYAVEHLGDDHVSTVYRCSMR